MRSDIRDALSGGDRRSIGNASRAIALIEAEPARFHQIVDGLDDADALVRLRCADVAEKLSARHPNWLRVHKDRLMELARSATEQELRWHLAQMLPRLDLSEAERHEAFTMITGYLNDRSRIVIASALTALVQIAADDAVLRKKARQYIRRSLEHVSPAVRARASKLAKLFKD